MELAEEIAALDARALAPVVERLFGRRVTPLTWAVTPFTYQATNSLSEGVFRVSGTARDGAAVRDWSVVVKVLRPAYDVLLAWFPEESRAELEDAHRWDREVHAYESGLLDRLPAGLAAPRCLGVRRDADRCWLWLEDLGPTDPGWDVPRYALAARHLGRFNGAFPAASVPDAAWLSHGWLRTWLVTGFGSRAEFVLGNDDVWEHEIVRSAFAADDRERLERHWAERAAVLDRLDALPQTLCHLDAFRANLIGRTNARGEPETVAIDWAGMGLAPIGAEVGQLVMGSVSFADYRQDIRELAPAAVDGYIAGLRESGWNDAERDVRTGFALSAVRWVFMLGILNAALDPVRQAEVEKWAGQPYVDTLTQAGTRTRYLLGLLDSAR
ncbi:MAG: hypothetical protein QOH08_401 [Chloroflexota bacterium]|nr:hypothetical protein [Chloroflexota bacterium]